MRGEAEHAGRWEQTQKWAGAEGVAYTERNPQTVSALDELKRENYGVSQTELHRGFLSSLPDTLDVLEVGTNIGLQLETLRRLGFRSLTGVDVSRYAVEKGRRKHPELELLTASAHRLPFGSRTGTSTASSSTRTSTSRSATGGCTGRPISSTDSDRDTTFG
jgi:hypothetical protein